MSLPKLRKLTLLFPQPSKRPAPAASSLPSNAPAARPPPRMLSPDPAARAEPAPLANALVTVPPQRTLSHPARPAPADLVPQMPAHVIRQPLPRMTGQSMRSTSLPASSYLHPAKLRVALGSAFEGLRDWLYGTTATGPTVEDKALMVYDGTVALERTWIPDSDVREELISLFVLLFYIVFRAVLIVLLCVSLWRFYWQFFSEYDFSPRRIGRWFRDVWSRFRLWPGDVWSRSRGWLGDVRGRFRCWLGDVRSRFRRWRTAKQELWTWRLKFWMYWANPIRIWEIPVIFSAFYMANYFGKGFPKVLDLFVSEPRVLEPVSTVEPGELKPEELERVEQSEKVEKPEEVEEPKKVEKPGQVEELPARAPNQPQNGGDGNRRNKAKKKKNKNKGKWLLKYSMLDLMLMMTKMNANLDLGAIVEDGVASYDENMSRSLFGLRQFWCAASTYTLTMKTHAALSKRPQTIGWQTGSTAQCLRVKTQQNENMGLGNKTQEADSFDQPGTISRQIEEK
ncbi:hypothetical protein CSAL01_07456 [Colletotrichum salicis]|uniref:Uncharacterized protein n=1 Tax=Colletotrichum salicis TaxID=1209931 RepID=A0A135UAT2_9PEZI|nr:hypothetical protein CSAL01_07456 [Colletotrichum salicis]